MPVTKVVDLGWVRHPLCLCVLSCVLGNLSSDLSTEFSILAIIILFSRALIDSLVVLFFFFN